MSDCIFCPTDLDIEFVDAVVESLNNYDYETD